MRTWEDLEGITLSEINQAEKDNHLMFSHLYLDYRHVQLQPFLLLRLPVLLFFKDEERKDYCPGTVFQACLRS